MRYGFIRDNSKQYPVTLLCQALEVCRSGYYSWRRFPESKRSRENNQLLIKIKDVYTMSKNTYGSPRIYASLRQRGEMYGKHRITRLMRINGIAAKHRRRYRATTNSDHTMPVAANVLNREFAITELNRVWVNDITYIPTSEGWLYLAVVMDLASRRIVGWSMSSRINHTLVCDALINALQRREPEKGLIHHSDRGVQYASTDYQKILTEYGLIPSMSRKGNCWDNAPMESFFHSLKVEWLHEYQFKTRDEARQAIFIFIETWYNRQRLHSGLGYLSPDMYERMMAP